MVLLGKVPTSTVIYQIIPSQVTKSCKYFTVWKTKFCLGFFIKYNILCIFGDIMFCACFITNSNTPPWVFFMLFKFYKCHQITQSVSIMLGNSKCEEEVAQMWSPENIFVKKFAKFTGKHLFRKFEKLFLSLQF